MNSTQPAMSTSVPSPFGFAPCGKVPQQERFLRAVHPNQGCEGDPEDQVELVSVRLKETSECSLLYIFCCHRPRLSLRRDSITEGLHF